MRTFQHEGISVVGPVEILVMDDALVLPDDISDTTVYYFLTEGAVGDSLPVYREGGSMVCFSTEGGARKKARPSQDLWSSKLSFLILTCQHDKVAQLIIQ